MPASKPPSRRTPRGGEPPVGSRPSSASRPSIRDPKGRPGQAKSKHSGERPERREPSRRDDNRGAKPRGPSARDARPQRGSRDAESGPPKETRPYRKSNGDSTSRRPSTGRKSSSRTERPTRFGSSRAPTPLTPEQRKRQEAGERAKQQGWGSVARKGANNITSTGAELGDAKSRKRTPDPMSQWESVERPEIRSAAAGKTKVRVKYALPGEVAAEGPSLVRRTCERKW